MNELLDSIDFDELEHQDLRESLPLDRFLWLESKSLENLVREIKRDISPLISSNRKDVAEKTDFALRILLLNLLKLEKPPLPLLLAVSKSAAAYTIKKRYSQPLLSYRTLMSVYNALMEKSYTQIVINGHWDKEKHKGEVTRISVTNKLRRLFKSHLPQNTVFFSRHKNEEIIIQKNLNKKRVEYNDTKYSRSARDNLATINKCLTRHWYDLDLSNEGFQTFYRDWIKKRQRKELMDSPEGLAMSNVIDFTSRSLYRVYNNGGAGAAKTNFKEGGRFYGGWWQQIPSEYRRYITINHKHTVELDFSNLHPHMLYALVGKKLEGDAYELNNVPAEHRKYIKIAFNQLINGKGRAKIPIGFAELGLTMSWSELRKAVAVRHAPISEYFNSGYGLVLQHQDSEILERVLLHFTKNDIPCLPVHDSVIIHHHLKDELLTTMIEAYKGTTHEDIEIDVEDNFQFFIERYVENDTNTNDIALILQEDSESIYEQRWLEWCQSK